MGREKRLGFETTLLVYIWVCVSVWVILKKKKKEKKTTLKQRPGCRWYVWEGTAESRPEGGEKSHKVGVNEQVAAGDSWDPVLLGPL